MHSLPLPVVVAYVLSLAFGSAGIVQLAGLGGVRAAYLRMGYPARAFRLTGSLELLAACLLAVSSVRPLGVAVATAINFLAVVLLLKNRKYLFALPGMVVMTALPFVLLPVS